MRRRRKRRYNWFPVLPTTTGEGSSGATYFEVIGEQAGPLPAFSTFSPVYVPLLGDQTATWGANNDAGASLRDRVEGQEYVIERIVGKVWVERVQGGNETSESQARTIHAIGIGVMPVDDDTQDLSLAEEDVDPLNADTSDKSWMFRRTWVLGNNAANPGHDVDDPQNILYGIQPTGSYFYGSLEDGGHVDIKTVRRVRRDQRLFIIHNAGLLSTDMAAATGATWRWGYDLRVLGAMRKARNQSVFS